MFYHGSKHKIEKFTDDFVGGKEAHDQEGPGIYFTSSFDDARRYGEYVYTVKLNPKKIISVKEGKRAPVKQLEWLAKQSSDWQMHAQNWDENPNIGLKQAIQNTIEHNENPHEQFLQIWIEFFRNEPANYVRNMVKLGYDVIYVPKNEGVIHAIILNPTIIEFVEMKHDVEDSTLQEIRKSVRKLFLSTILNEEIKIPIEIGDTVLGGKFKNKKIVVKTIDKNEKGDITINGKPLLRFRIIKDNSKNN